MEIGSLTLIYIIKKKKEGFNLYFFPESWRQLITQLSWTHLFDSCFISSEKKIFAIQVNFLFNLLSKISYTTWCDLSAENHTLKCFSDYNYRHVYLYTAFNSDLWVPPKQNIYYGYNICIYISCHFYSC